MLGVQYSWVCQKHATLNRTSSIEQLSTMVLLRYVFIIIGRGLILSDFFFTNVYKPNWLNKYLANYKYKFLKQNLLNKYQFTWDSHIFMDSGISISVPYQIDVVKWYGFSLDFCHLFDIDFFYQQIRILEDGNDIYSIFYFLHISKKLSQQI